MEIHYERPLSYLACVQTTNIYMENYIRAGPSTREMALSISWAGSIAREMPAEKTDMFISGGEKTVFSCKIK